MNVLTCDEQGCDEPTAELLKSRCHYHEALRNARELSPDRLAALRAAMANVKPITDDERHERRIQSHLWSVKHYAKEYADAQRRARVAGATEDQITSASESSLAGK